jgi:hypothetical protein
MGTSSTHCLALSNAAVQTFKALIFFNFCSASWGLSQKSAACVSSSLLFISAIFLSMSKKPPYLGQTPF